MGQVIALMSAMGYWFEGKHKESNDLVLEFLDKDENRIEVKIKTKD